jgi:hypothetical protein
MNERETKKKEKKTEWPALSLSILILNPASPDSAPTPLWKNLAPA